MAPGAAASTGPPANNQPAAAAASSTGKGNGGIAGDVDMDTAGEAGEAEDEAERPKKRAALQRKVALLHHQLQGAEKAQDQVFHLLGKMSSQWSRNVV
eukprot:1708407-Prorocentrum_lima.AAC.1